MRAVALLAIGVVGFLGARAPAADAPAIVIPTRPGVPVIINGVDASYCVVEGDWGLARPGHVQVTIVACPHHKPIPGYDGSYFPALGRRPGYGRFEIEPPPNRALPPPAEDYFRRWDSHSDPVPASGGDPPANVDVTVVPQVERRRRRLRRPD